MNEVKKDELELREEIKRLYNELVIEKKIMPNFLTWLKMKGGLHFL